MAAGRQTDSSPLNPPLPPGVPQVEEHQLLAPADGPDGQPSSRLLSERRLSRHAIVDLSCLPPAACLAARSEDGAAVVASYDNPTMQPLAGVKGNAVAMAGDAARAPARLAVAVRSGPGALAVVKAAAAEAAGRRRAGGGSEDGGGAAGSQLQVYSVGAGPGSSSRGLPHSPGRLAHLIAKVRRLPLSLAIKPSCSVRETLV